MASLSKCLSMRHCGRYLSPFDFFEQKNASLAADLLIPKIYHLFDHGVKGLSHSVISTGETTCCEIPHPLCLACFGGTDAKIASLRLELLFLRSIFFMTLVHRLRRASIRHTSLVYVISIAVFLQT